MKCSIPACEENTDCHGVYCPGHAVACSNLSGGKFDPAHPDADVVHKMPHVILNELLDFRAAVRHIRSQRGDDRCWLDYLKLFQLLPEPYVACEIDSEVMLENCKKFIKSCNDPDTKYVSPERRIEQLEARVRELLKDRITDLEAELCSLSKPS